MHRNPRDFLVAALIFVNFCGIAAPAEDPAQFENDSPQLSRYDQSRISMGCVYSIVLYAPDATRAKQAFDSAFNEVDRIDRLMSHYRSDSELTRINREAAKLPITVKPELCAFIDKCLVYSRESDGAFDITVGPLMKAWGFFRGEGRMPTDAELVEARSRVGYQHVIVDRTRSSIYLDRADIELDLGGIAKGYAVDRAVNILQGLDVQVALVNAGGSTLYGLGTPPGEAAWEVRIEDPLHPGQPGPNVMLKNQSLSVSGSYEKFFRHQGVRYSHIMDPRTGRPVQDVLSVAVVTCDGLSSDALDNALFVLGVERGRPLLERYPGSTAYFFLPASEHHSRMITLQGGSAAMRPTK